MTVTYKQKVSVYNYVYPCYKAEAQRLVCMNVIHPMETYDMATVGDNTGAVVGGEGLNEGYNRRILPPINPRFSGRPKVKRYELPRQDVKVRRCCLLYTSPSPRD